jgi:hypothetical protein
MTVKKLQFAPGFNQEVTRYTGEGRWWTGDKVRFRMGFPEKIGGYARLSENTYLGIARSIFPWSTLSGLSYVGVGTHLKYYVELSGSYYDITPIRATATLTNPFTATNGSNILTVSDVAHGASAGDFVTFSGATGLGGNITNTVLNKEYQVVEVLDADSYTVQMSVTANATDASGSPGGGTVTAAYQIPVGADIQVALSGWGSGSWGFGTWGNGATTFAKLRIWSQSNFGEDLVFAPRGAGMYYWDASAGTGTRGVNVTTMMGASDVPTVVNSVLVSDVSRFVFALGCNELGSSTLDPMLIRWSDQEDITNWTPGATNQAGGLRLSVGSDIIARIQTRQEILVWTDVALYSLQYQGAPIVWGAQILGDNISILGPNCVAVANNVSYWMGNGKFYKYDGAVQTLRCDLRRKVFSSLNYDQSLQVFAGTNEQFNEIWWFYPSGTSTVPNKYVIYNYLEDIWYDGELTRYAWVDRGLKPFPIAAAEHTLIEQEFECCDSTGDVTVPIPAYIESSEFDLDDGDRFAFVTRILPDITFTGSTTATPQATITLYPMTNSGTGFGDSVGGSRTANTTRSVSAPVEQFTGQVYVRVRGRQMVFRLESSGTGVKWQMGSMRYDVRPDGKRG